MAGDQPVVAVQGEQARDAVERVVDAPCCGRDGGDVAAGGERRVETGEQLVGGRHRPGVGTADDADDAAHMSRQATDASGG